MKTPNLDKLLGDAAGGTSIFGLEKDVPAGLKEFSAWKADIETRLQAIEAWKADVETRLHALEIAYPARVTGAPADPTAGAGA